MIKYINVILICLSFFIIRCEKNPTNNNQNIQNEERILFIRAVKSELSQICTMKPDGSDINIIYETELSYTNKGIQYAIWSPDKSKILFEGGPNSSLEENPIWILDATKGEILYQLASDGGNSLWSSDGEYIIFTKRNGYGSLINDLYRIKSDGSNEELLFHQDSLTIYATDWSDDGKELLVCTQQYYTDSENKLSVSRTKIGVFDIGTKNIEYIVQDDMQNTCAKWSADQSKIIYISGLYTLKYDIYLLTLENNIIESLTNSMDYYSNVIWSINDKNVAYTKRNANLSGQFSDCNDIFIMDMNSKVITNITNTASDSISCKVMDWK